MIKLILVVLVVFIVGCGRAKFSTTQSEVQCSSQESNGNIIVNCPNGMQYAFPAPIDGVNGLNGKDGTNGANAQGITIVDPCGDLLNQVDEILLVFPDKSVLAWYQGVGFVVLTPGVTYQTTDSQHCVFNIDADGNVND